MQDSPTVTFGEDRDNFFKMVHVQGFEYRYATPPYTDNEEKEAHRFSTAEAVIRQFEKNILAAFGFEGSISHIAKRSREVHQLKQENAELQATIRSLNADIEGMKEILNP